MKKKVLLRGLMGLPIGIAIGQCIAILVSLRFAGGQFSPCEPELVALMGNEVSAVAFQTALSGALGFGFGASSVIWEVERWGLVKQTAVYFLLISVIMLPIAWLNRWMEHSVAGFAEYFGIFVAIFVVMWVIMFLIGRQSVKRLNAGLRNTKHNSDEWK